MVDVLILGAGWTSTFLIPLCESRNVSLAATSRSGRNSTIQFEFAPDSEDDGPYKTLPDARTVLITFPITLSGASERLVRLYESTRLNKNAENTRFIQLGTTSIWKAPEGGTAIIDRHSEITVTDRAQAENELLGLRLKYNTTVLNLSGLWGGERQPRHLVKRVAPTKEALREKGSIHLIHGVDVARAILAIHVLSDEDFKDRTLGQRWIIADQHVYDWWDLASRWDENAAVWVTELLNDANIRVLPRPLEKLGRAMDSREFWKTFGIAPTKTLITYGD